MTPLWVCTNAAKQCKVLSITMQNMKQVPNRCKVVLEQLDEVIAK